MKVVAVVGPCASGKSTVVAALRERGYDARHVAQEHSYVPDMWERIVHPDALIYLDASHATSLRRRHLNWTETEHAEQIHRLRHARQSADLYLRTDDLTPAQLLHAVFQFLETSPLQAGH